MGASGRDAAAPDADRDGNVDGGTDSGETSGCRVPQIAFDREAVGLTVDGGRTVRLSLQESFFCGEALVALSASSGSIVDFPAEVVIGEDASRTPVRLVGVSMGETTITATWQQDGMTRTATLEVIVTDDRVPGCDGSASGEVVPGGEVRVSQGALEGARVALPEGAADEDRYHVDPFDVSIECGGSDQVPDGYEAIGPAVTLSPQHKRFDREIPVAIPVKLSLLAEDVERGHVQLSYTGPGLGASRVVPVASRSFEGSPGDGLVRFVTPRLGTYQPVVREELPIRRSRRMTYRAFTGVSMGSGGAGLIGLKHSDRFDFLAPLGGPVDWIYMLHYMRTYHMGGFCTEAQRLADPSACAAGADVSRTPPPTELHEHRQDFEHWFYQDEYGGQGGTFDREEYVNIFRDLTRMYGNSNTNRATDPDVPNITPPGVPDGRRMQSDQQRCEDPVVIPACEGSFPDCADNTGFVDDEYNPEGQHPVITFCDGNEVRMDGERDVGVWAPGGGNDFPVEVLVAVDIDEDGQRDRGEPVIRNGREPFEDCGLDGTCNPDEPGFDAVTNPDPNGDDYDFQFNPTGTEGNWWRDTPDDDRCNSDGEAYRDVGLDGIEGSKQLDEGGFDEGEGNGCWDLAQGSERMIERNPRSMVLDKQLQDLRNIDVFTDGGIRDLFNFGVAHDQFAGAFAARGRELNLFNGHTALDFDHTNDGDTFDYNEIDWDNAGKYVMVRYGDPDASEQALREGDGGHVGTGQQLLNRLLGALAWMSARWPGGDRRMVDDRLCSSDQDCPNPNQITFEFESSTGRTGPVSVVLPPGYYDEEYQDYRYPVVYLGHGYGQEPSDLIVSALFLWNEMVSGSIPRSQRLQKMIFVFPDGRCRGDECLQGTFYTNAPRGHRSAPQMETFVLDLMDHIDEQYRTRDPRMVEVVE